MGNGDRIEKSVWILKSTAWNSMQSPAASTPENPVPEEKPPTVSGGKKDIYPTRILNEQT